jgi:deoxyribose-phosphate aldolase
MPAQATPTSHQKLQTLLSCIDLTSLEGTDHPGQLGPLLEKANKGFNHHYVAAVCVYPLHGDFIRKQLNPVIKTAVVGGFFPSGQTFLTAKLEELRAIAQTSCEEVDLVINRGMILAGHYDEVHNEIAAMRAVIPCKLVKVILETGELGSKEHIRKASEIAINAGADFIKTSTGKSAVGATTEAVEIMCEVIRNTYQATGKKTGIKPSGGIRETRQALAYFETIRTILGEDWMTPRLFRLGASSLYDDLLSQLHNGHE